VRTQACLHTLPKYASHGGRKRDSLGMHSKGYCINKHLHIHSLPSPKTMPHGGTVTQAWCLPERASSASIDAMTSSNNQRRDMDLHCPLWFPPSLPEPEPPPPPPSQHHPEVHLSTPTLEPVQGEGPSRPCNKDARWTNLGRIRSTTFR
jgi:hypothetical protein